MADESKAAIFAASVVFVNESSHQAAVYAFSRTSNGVRIGTVMSGLSRARQALRDAVEQEMGAARS